jgi:predicted lactoylglutathione lyase
MPMRDIQVASAVYSRIGFERNVRVVPSRTSDIFAS